MSGSPAPHVWWSPLELFYFSGREKTYTKRSNHTGDPGCNHGSVCLPPQWATRPFIWATDCAESIFKLFNFISCSNWGGRGGIPGTPHKDISGDQLLLIVFLLCRTICLLELSGIIDEQDRCTHLFPLFSALLICQ